MIIKNVDSKTTRLTVEMTQQEYSRVVIALNKAYPSIVVIDEHIKNDYAEALNIIKKHRTLPIVGDKK